MTLGGGYLALTADNGLREQRDYTLNAVSAIRNQTGSVPTLDADTLSLQRATLVVDWLTARGVERERLKPRGCGARRPLTLGNTALERAMNRRAELVRLAPPAACEPPW